MQKFLSRFDGGCNLGTWGISVTYHCAMFHCVDMQFGPFWCSIYVGGLEDTI